MKRLIVFILLVAALSGCTTKKQYITQVVSPTDWQPPVVTWVTPPDSPLRGTAGLDVHVTDSSRVDRVMLYVDGRETETMNQAPYRFELHSDSLTDGVHLCEARAVDQFGNLGISPVLRIFAANGTVEGIRLLWVPDSFATIQAAINAATDFDTIRVRDGVYYETLNLFGKGIWLESEHGSLRATIDGQGAQNTLFSTASRERLTIRGFRFVHGGGIAVQFDDGSQFAFVNNIAEADSDEALVYARRTAGYVRNNLLIGRNLCVEIWALEGTVENNILERASVAAMWNTNFGRNPVEYGYNLFWENRSDYYNFQPSATDVDGDPLIDLANGRLLSGSPAINSGRPDVLDRDGTRSDIGPFGGPYAY